MIKEECLRSFEKQGSYILYRFVRVKGSYYIQKSNLIKDYKVNLLINGFQIKSLENMTYAKAEQLFISLDTSGELDE